MPRLIDADELTHYLAVNDDGKQIFYVKSKDIDNAPTIDPVHAAGGCYCKECRYWGDENGFLRTKDGIIFARCKVHNHATYDGNVGWCPTENDYCSLGIRRKDDDD